MRALTRHVSTPLLSSILAVFFVAGLGGARHADAAQQYQGLCSLIEIEIEQELTLERIGFLATLKVTNNEGDASITNFSANLTFESNAFSDDGSYEDSSDLFFVQPPELSGINAIDGSGLIPPGKTAVVTWFMIPTITAGGMTPEGIRYRIGAELGAMLNGQPVPADSLLVIADNITVRPEPQLEITYFQPRDVDGDNPFTPDIVESPIPFTLGVLVHNAGFGSARALKIDSQQPRIVENEQGLLVVPFLLGSKVMDVPTPDASLLVDLGDIGPGGCRKGSWDMITTLSGEFTDFSATFTHAPELGGDATSVITELNAWFIVHEVLNDQPGRDEVLDFLAVTRDVVSIPTIDENPVLIPDTLFETDCNTIPVNRLENVEVTDFAGGVATVHAVADFEGWVIIFMEDPGDARAPVGSVRRSDGKLLNAHNAWTHLRYRKPDNARLPYLYIFDFVSLGEFDYTVTYDLDDSDVDPPVTSLLFAGQHEEVEGTHYVLPDTQMFFVVDDASQVGTYRRLDGEGDFLPAYPFTIAEAGTHVLEYYSEDALENTELVRSATIVVSGARPSLSEPTVDVDEIFLSGGALSVRPADATLDFTADSGGMSLDVRLDVYSGAYAWPTLLGVPSTPTRSTSASLQVGGEHLDFYRYRVNGGVWSEDVAVSSPLDLSGLSGDVTLEVLGRSQHGELRPEDEALLVSWTVDAEAPLAEILAEQASPSRAEAASFLVSGVDEYRYTVDSDYYRAPAPVSEPIALTGLEAGEHVVDLVGRSGADPMPDPDDEATPRTALSHRVDFTYGLSFPGDARVYSAELGALSESTTITWDGRDDSGAVAPAGWYTMKATVTDTLGRSSSVARLVRVGDLLPLADALDDSASADQSYTDAWGNWVVWQDQRDGSWDIYAMDMSGSPPVASPIMSSAQNHERPRTDGVLVVWQARQLDGSWDIWARDLGDEAGVPYAITATPDKDETRPAVYWPWVVWQERSVSDPSAPWQLVAANLIGDTTEVVDTTLTDQLDPAVHQDSLVWQDFRDVGYGEIYAKDLHSGLVERITTDPGGQYHPDVYDHWIVWSDNRDTQLDLYAYNRLRGVERRLTDTTENEDHPSINGRWVVYEEDSVGLLSGSNTDTNLRILHVDSAANVQLTNTVSAKTSPRLSSGHVIWSDQASAARVRRGRLPDLQSVVRNRNMLAVTQGLADYVPDAHALLTLWNAAAGVHSISRYTSLAPSPVIETVTWSGGPSGPDFPLVPGSFLWVSFAEARILDFAESDCQPLDLSVGVNVVAFGCFPDAFSAHQLIRGIGLERVRAVRALDGERGRWVTASVVDGAIRGEDFRIDTVSALLLDLSSEVLSWTP